MIAVNAPWTDDQVASLNAFQNDERNHPFTGRRKTDGSNTLLIATPSGWIEEKGGPVVQAWAHDWMANWEWQTPGKVRTPGRWTGATSLDGVLLPCDKEEVPITFAPLGTQDIYVACFSTIEKLMKTLDKGRVPFAKVIEIKNGKEFIKAIPLMLDSRLIKIVLDPYYTEEDQMSFIEVERTSGN